MVEDILSRHVLVNFGLCLVLTVIIVVCRLGFGHFKLIGISKLSVLSLMGKRGLH